MTLALGGLILALIWWALWRLTTDSRSVGQILSQATGHFLEIGLYKDQPRAMGESLWELQRVSLRLGWVLLAPSLLFLIPLVLVGGYLGACSSHRPLLPGESAVLSVRGPAKVRLVLHPSLVEEAGPLVRDVNGKKETVWRISGTTPGSFQVAMEVGEKRYLKRVRVGAPGPAVKSTRSSRWLGWLQNPTELPLSGEAEVRLDYPPHTTWLGVWSVPWWLVLLGWFLLFVTVTGRFLAGELRG